MNSTQLRFIMSRNWHWPAAFSLPSENHLKVLVEGSWSVTRVKGVAHCRRCAPRGPQNSSGCRDKKEGIICNYDKTGIKKHAQKHRKDQYVEHDKIIWGKINTYKKMTMQSWNNYFILIANIIFLHRNIFISVHNVKVPSVTGRGWAGWRDGFWAMQL